MLIDTHRHIHEADYPDASGALDRAHQAGVSKMVCVGTSNETSREAAEFAQWHDDVYFSAGTHPHDSGDGYGNQADYRRKSKKLVAIGEIGLDYFYTHSPKETQIKDI